MSWSQQELQAEVSSAQWGPKVLVALKQYFSEGRPLLEAAVLIDAGLKFDSDGTPILFAVYDHPYYDRRIGLRHRLNDFPLTIPEGSTPAEGMAETIALYEISEPLGTWQDKLVEDNAGVWWWTWPLD
jgi:hypothetical protein